MTKFANYFSTLRQKTGMTLRQFCIENEFDPGNMSRIERGRLNPPRKRETLEKWAQSLKLQKGSDDWMLFFDYAAVANQSIPADLMSDDVVIEKLPLVFRTLRGEKVSDNQLQKLVEKIRGA
jgi:transcriptional regulator with XRE-family HTH domain